jgi:hypothetical protein
MLPEGHMVLFVATSCLSWLKNQMHASCIICWNDWYYKLLGPEWHGKEQQQKKTCRLQQLERDFHDLFKYETAVLALDQNLFDSTHITELIISLPPGKIKKWVKSCHLIILHCMCKVIENSITNVQLLPKYFPPLSRSKPHHPWKLQLSCDDKAMLKTWSSPSDLLSDIFLSVTHLFYRTVIKHLKAGTI